MGKRIELGVTTLADEIVAYDGGDWEQKHRQRSIEHHERVEAGLEAPLTAPVPAGAAGMPLPEPMDGADGEGADDLEGPTPAEDTGSEDPSETGPTEPSLAAAIMALAVKETPAAQVHLTVEGAQISVPPSNITVEAPSVSFEAQMPEPSPPTIVIQQPPKPEVARAVRVVRDADGKATGIRVEPEAGDRAAHFSVRRDPTTGLLIGVDPGPSAAGVNTGPAEA